MRIFDGQELEQLKENYQKKGYVVVPDFFSPNEMVYLTAWTNEIMNWPTVNEKWLKYYELGENHDKVLSRIENFVEYHAEFKLLVRDAMLLNLLTTLLGEPVIFFKEKLNLKAPGARGYTPHQDAPAFFDIDYDAISLFIAVDPATIANGCLYFVKNGDGFKNELLPQNAPNRALSKDVVDSLQWEPVECKPGDVIIFSAYAPHYSTQNNTIFGRRAVFLTFGKKTKSTGKTRQYFSQKRKIFPQDSEKKPHVDYTKAARIYSFSSPVIVNLKSFRKK